MSAGTKIELFVNRTAGELRAGLVEDDQLLALQVERASQRGVVGNVYKGRIVRIVPGMQAAFVDCGLARAAFLYVGDLVEQKVVLPEPDAGDDEPVSESLAQAITGAFQAVKEARVELETQPAAEAVRPKPLPIQNQLSPGQEILVQVSKEPLGTKGARVTAQIALPGRWLVYLPHSDHTGVSRRITDDDERARLRGVLDSVRRPTEGVIVRTVCVGRSAEDLLADFGRLRAEWAAVKARAASSSVPALIHEEPDLVMRTARDLMGPHIRRLVLDDRGDFDRASAFVQRHTPSLSDRVQLYEDATPLFESAGLETQIERALGRSVRLPSGGSIVIDHTEALTAVDVNSGRYTGGRNLGEMTLKVNLEAATALVHQLRLREIGGLIVIDFIDMEDLSHRDRVFQHLQALLEKDPARSTVLPISEFGLVEMTRRRVRENLAVQLLDSCDACHGRARSKSAETITYEVLREAWRQVRGTVVHRVLQLRVSPEVAGQLEGDEKQALDALFDATQREVRVVRDGRLDRDQFAVSFVRDA